MSEVIFDPQPPYRQQDLLDESNFKKYCKELGLVIDTSSLKNLELLNLIKPISKQALQKGRKQKLFYPKNMFFMIETISNFAEVKLYGFKLMESSDSLDKYLEDLRISLHGQIDYIKHYIMRCYRIFSLQDSLNNLYDEISEAEFHNQVENITPFEIDRKPISLRETYQELIGYRKYAEQTILKEKAHKILTDLNLDYELIADMRLQLILEGKKHDSIFFIWDYLDKIPSKYFQYSPSRQKYAIACYTLSEKIKWFETLLGLQTLDLRDYILRDTAYIDICRHCKKSFKPRPDQFFCNNDECQRERRKQNMKDYRKRKN